MSISRSASTVFVCCGSALRDKLLVGYYIEWDFHIVVATEFSWLRHAVPSPCLLHAMFLDLPGNTLSPLGIHKCHRRPYLAIMQFPSALATSHLARNLTALPKLLDLSNLMLAVHCNPARRRLPPFLLWEENHLALAAEMLRTLSATDILLVKIWPISYLCRGHCLKASLNNPQRNMEFLQ